MEDWIQLYQLDIYQAQSVRCDAKSLEDALIKHVMVTPEEVASSCNFVTPSLCGGGKRRDGGSKVRVGRKRAMRMSTAFWITGWLALIFSKDMELELSHMWTKESSRWTCNNKSAYDCYWNFSLILNRKCHNLKTTSSGSHDNNTDSESNNLQWFEAKQRYKGTSSKKHGNAVSDRGYGRRQQNSNDRKELNLEPLFLIALSRFMQRKEPSDGSLDDNDSDGDRLDPHQC
ncbi:hypothetical protein AHAS_Ahas01G0099200 [Arachis hypogaea]